MESDLAIANATFHHTFNLFQVDRPEEVTISIRHHAGFPDLEGQDLGEEVYQIGDWRIHKRSNAWIYLRTSASETRESERRSSSVAYRNQASEGIERLAIFDHDHTRARVFGDLGSLLRLHSSRSDHSLLTPARLLGLLRAHRQLHSFRSDHNFLTLAALAQVLADRGGCFIHSSGAIMDGQGFLFVGHSDAGKSTIRAMLKDEAGVEILGDDRNVIGRWPDGYRVHGVWSSMSVEDVSAASAPLRAILWLEQAPENRLIPLDDRMEVIRKLLATAEWWDKSLLIAQDIARQVPCYILRFDLSGGGVT